MSDLTAARDPSLCLEGRPSQLSLTRISLSHAGSSTNSVSGDGHLRRLIDHTLLSPFHDYMYFKSGQVGTYQFLSQRLRSTCVRCFRVLLLNRGFPSFFRMVSSFCTPKPGTCTPGYFGVSIIHRVLTWTTGSLTCVGYLFARLAYTHWRRTFVESVQNLTMEKTASWQAQSLASSCHSSIW